MSHEIVSDTSIELFALGRKISGEKRKLPLIFEPLPT